VGLPPSESSRGPQRRQGAITKAGHTHARRALVEGTWAYRYPAQVSRHLQLRLETHPKVLQDSSWKGHVRRCKRYRQRLARGKHANQVVVAIARELVGFLGAMANEVTVTPAVHQMDGPGTNEAASFPRASEATPPRCGATLGGVKRPTGILVPSVRPAPDGRQSGGTQSTDISLINRRM
jgi:hypothetical protein